MSKPLPPGQTKILLFFADAEDGGHQPSRAEVAKAMGYAFPSAVSKHVEALGADCFRHTPPPGHTGFYETKFRGPDGVVFDISEHPWPGLSAEDSTRAKVKVEAAE